MCFARTPASTEGHLHRRTTVCAHAWREIGASPEVMSWIEHGVGIEKINQMCVQYKSPELETFHRIKAAFDETGLLNPGKAVPSLHRCAEYGRMHVHQGETKFPELERF